MDRERIVWAFACHSCMCDMDDEMITWICKRNDDIFELKDNTIKFTKVFLKEATNLL